MNEIAKSIEDILKNIKPEIDDYYNKCYSYFLDLIISKQVNIKKLIKLDDETTVKKNILTIISATNSALNTIGISSNMLSLNSEIYKRSFENNRSKFTSYFDFLNLSLRNYINRFLFISVIEYIANIDKKKIENLDLFDLLPRGFLDRLNHLKYESLIPENVTQKLNQFFIQIDDLFDVTNLTFKQVDFQLGAPKEIRSEAEFLIKLQEARTKNINTLQKPESQKSVSHLSYLDLMINFSAINQSLLNDLKINLGGLSDCILNNPGMLDLETLYYAICIFKSFEQDFPLNLTHIIDLMNNFVNGKIFSTSKHHPPNPISIFYGLAIFNYYNLFNSSNLIDTLEIEMFLENELLNFIPENVYVNFYKLISLRILEKNGSIIKDKSYLIESLKNLNLNDLQKSKLSMDLFYYLSILKLLDYEIDASKYSQDIELIKQSLHENGSMNNSITDTSRTLLVLQIMRSKGSLINKVGEFLKTPNYFSDGFNGSFNWKKNKVAFKIELRLLFWALLALSFSV